MKSHQKQVRKYTRKLSLVLQLFFCQNCPSCISQPRFFSSKWQRDRHRTSAQRTDFTRVHVHRNKTPKHCPIEFCLHADSPFPTQRKLVQHIHATHSPSLLDQNSSFEFLNLLKKMGDRKAAHSLKTKYQHLLSNKPKSINFALADEIIDVELGETNDPFVSAKLSVQKFKDMSPANKSAVQSEYFELVTKNFLNLPSRDVDSILKSGQHIFVHNQADALLGFLSFKLYQDRGVKFASITLIATYPHSYGGGSLLMEKLESICESSGVEQIFVFSGGSAVDFYKTVGFSKIRRGSNQSLVGKIRPQFLETVVMKKVL